MGLFPQMDDIRNTIENYRIITVYGSNETNGVYLKVKYERQEDGSDVGEPMEFYTGSQFLFLYKLYYSPYSPFHTFLPSPILMSKISCKLGGLGWLAMWGWLRNLR